MPKLPSSVEVAIVGAGPAGLATALSLAKNAPRKLGEIAVLERAHFPREKYCAGGLGARAEKVLDSLGVRLSVPSVPVQAICVQGAEQHRTLRAASPIGKVIRRLEFDASLAQAAEQKGIGLYQGVRVEGLSRSAGGLELQTSQGPIRAQIVVGADGVGSVIRRALGLEGPQYHAQVLELDTEPSKGDCPRDTLLFDASDRELTGYVWDFPTLVDGKEMVCRGAYVLQIGQKILDPRQALEKHLGRRGLELRHYKQKRYAERGYVPSQALSGPGILLVGEAAGVDPVTGEGIPHALAYGELAGRYLSQKLDAGRGDFADWSRWVKKSLWVGRDLGLRSRITPHFYGKHRPYLERLLLERPWFGRAALEFFAGRHVPRTWLLRAGLFGLELGWQALRHRG